MIPGTFLLNGFPHKFYVSRHFEEVAFLVCGTLVVLVCVRAAYLYKGQQYTVTVACLLRYGWQFCILKMELVTGNERIMKCSGQIIVYE